MRRAALCLRGQPFAHLKYSGWKLRRGRQLSQRQAACTSIRGKRRLPQTGALRRRRPRAAQGGGRHGLSRCDRKRRPPAPSPTLQAPRKVLEPQGAIAAAPTNLSAKEGSGGAVARCFFHARHKGSWRCFFGGSSLTCTKLAIYIPAARGPHRGKRLPVLGGQAESASSTLQSGHGVSLEGRRCCPGAPQTPASHHVHRHSQWCGRTILVAPCFFCRAPFSTALCFWVWAAFFMEARSSHAKKLDTCILAAPTPLF